MIAVLGARGSRTSRAGAGLQSVPDWRFGRNRIPDGRSRHFSTNTGYNVGVAVGFKPHVAADLACALKQRTTNSDSAAVAATSTFPSFTGNVVYALPWASRLLALRDRRRGSLPSER